MSLKLNERYPGRFTNPSADYPSGSFKNRTTPTSKDGSYLERDWANDKEGFFQSLLSAAGLTANGLVDKVGASQFFDALIQTRQYQKGIAFTAGGTASALTLSPTPALTAYSAAQRFRVKFNTANSGAAVTLNVSGLGAKNLTQYSVGGVKVPAQYVVGMLSDIEYDGTDWVLLNQLPASNTVGSQGSPLNLKGNASGTNLTSFFTADEITLRSAAGQYVTVANMSLALSFSNAGVNGIDTGGANSQLINSWWYAYAVYNSSNSSITGVLSLNPTTPTLPSGYTYWTRVGALRIDGTANKFPLGFFKAGKNVQYKVAAGSNVVNYPVMASGNYGNAATPTYVAISTASFVPPTGVAIGLYFYVAQATAQAILSPNPATGGSNSFTNPPFAQVGQPSGGGMTSATVQMVLETTNVYIAASGSSTLLLACTGYEDSV